MIVTIQLNELELERHTRVGRRPTLAAALIWFEIWAVVDPGQKISINFHFFR